MEYLHPSARKPETTLFHYTSQSGLLGIVRSKTIWATNIHYFNDVTEFYHAVQLAKREIRRQKKTTNATGATFLDWVNAELESLKETPIYVCSFSEDGDVLSQWRGYCPNGNGFSIGFEYSQLELPMGQQGFVLRQCIYEEGLKRTIIEGLVARAAHELMTFDAIIPDAWSSQWQVDWFVDVGACLKNSSFSEEREWRMISVKRPQFEPIHHREGKSMIIPYVEFKLAEKGENLKISKIIIGPTPHPELSKNSVISLLSSMKVECDDVQVSGIPYRAW